MKEEVVDCLNDSTTLGGRWHFGRRLLVRWKQANCANHRSATAPESFYRELALGDEQVIANRIPDRCQYLGLRHRWDDRNVSHCAGSVEATFDERQYVAEEFALRQTRCVVAGVRAGWVAFLLCHSLLAFDDESESSELALLQ